MRTIQRQISAGAVDGSAGVVLAHAVEVAEVHGTPQAPVSSSAFCCTSAHEPRDDSCIEVCVNTCSHGMQGSIVQDCQVSVQSLAGTRGRIADDVIQRGRVTIPVLDEVMSILPRSASGFG